MGDHNSNARNDLMNIQAQANQITDQSLESTRRMLGMCEESKEAGIRTLVMLDEQGEQLDRVEEGMDKINEDMRDAEKNLQGLEKCCGLCVLPWNRSKNLKKDYNQAWRANDDGKVAGSSARVVVDAQPGAGGAHGAGYVQRITNDAREDEMENNLADVSNMLGNLRNMAVDMGNEVSSQNNQLQRIDDKATQNEERIQQANKRANKILVS